jgi:NADPH2:quinone reductase
MAPRVRQFPKCRAEISEKRRAAWPSHAECIGNVVVRAWTILLPGDISLRVAAALILRGLTAHMPLTRTYPVSAKSMVLIHAVAGGLGLCWCVGPST